MDRNLGGVYGFCVGDALGVPAEFNSRTALHINPIEGMVPCENPKLPAGSWSDDTSMLLCTMDSLADGLDYEDMMVKFYRWFNYGEYSACGYCFDIGNTTRKALYTFAKGSPALECGRASEYDNGNGSLMRILPLAYYLPFVKDEARRMQIIHETSDLTHAHRRSHIGCGIYTMLAMDLLRGKSKEESLAALAKICKYYKNHPDYRSEYSHYRALDDIPEFLKREENYISSSGYVVTSLEAALWCFYNTHSYKACVLRAVNLGDDADTVAALAGGLAGIYYGYEAIPQEWLAALQNRELIEKVCGRFFARLAKLAEAENPA